MKALSPHKSFRCGKHAGSVAIALLLVLASVGPAPGHSVIVHEAITSAAITSTMSQAQNYNQFLNRIRDQMVPQSINSFEFGVWRIRKL